MPMEGVTRIHFKAFNWMEADKKYTAIALAPYFILFPVFHYMYLQPYLLVKLFGIIGFIWSSINLPMEFINYVKQKRKETSEAD